MPPDPDRVASDNQISLVKRGPSSAIHSFVENPVGNTPPTPVQH
jgi:hypothetical protein